MATNDMSVTEAAKVLGVSTRAVRGLLERGTLKGRKLGAHMWAVSRKAVEQRKAAA